MAQNQNLNIFYCNLFEISKINIHSPFKNLAHDSGNFWRLESNNEAEIDKDLFMFINSPDSRYELRFALINDIHFTYEAQQKIRSAISMKSKSQEPDTNYKEHPPIIPDHLKELIYRISLLKEDPDHKERAHESLVESFYEQLGYVRFTDIKYRQGRIDISILIDSIILIVNEVKKEWNLTYKRNDVRKQAFNYAYEVGAKHVVITNGDYYAFFNRRKGYSIESNLEKEFWLTKLRTEDIQFIETLKKENFTL